MHNLHFSMNRGCYLPLAGSGRAICMLHRMYNCRETEGGLKPPRVQSRPPSASRQSGFILKLLSAPPLPPAGDNNLLHWHATSSYGKSAIKKKVTPLFIKIFFSQLTELSILTGYICNERKS